MSLSYPLVILHTIPFPIHILLKKEKPSLHEKGWLYYMYSNATRKSAPHGIPPPPFTPARFQHARGIPKSPMYNSPVTLRLLHPTLGAPRHKVHLG